MKNIIAIIVAALIASCALITRTVYVPHGQAVRVRESVKGVKVWVRTEDGEFVAGKVIIPEGWYCLPDNGENNGE